MASSTFFKSLNCHVTVMLKIYTIFFRSLMYKSRGKFDQFDVVDIDPYGSASIFIDGAVQCVKSGGSFL